MAGFGAQMTICLHALEERESHTQDHAVEKITSKGIKILSCVGVCAAVTMNQN